MLITQEYREQNVRLHERGDYGISGHKHAQRVVSLCMALKTRDVLDYGAGRGTLAESLPFHIRQYDPCVESLSAVPEPADIVICTDVLEHIEPECLDEVLDDLQRVTGKVGFFVVATRPAKKTLPDGRNAHLIQENGNWWLPKFLSRFRVIQFADKGYEFEIMVG